MILQSKSQSTSVRKESLTLLTASIHVRIHCFCSLLKSKHSFNCWKHAYAAWIKRREWSRLAGILLKWRFWRRIKSLFYFERCVVADWPFRDSNVRCRSNSSRKCCRKDRLNSRWIRKFTYGDFTLHFNETLSIGINIFNGFIANLTCLNHPLIQTSLSPISLTRWAYWRAFNDSSRSVIQGLTPTLNNDVDQDLIEENVLQVIIKVLAFPPSESLSKRVIFESR